MAIDGDTIELGLPVRQQRPVAVPTSSARPTAVPRGQVAKTADNDAPGGNFGIPWRWTAAPSWSGPVTMAAMSSSGSAYVFASLRRSQRPSRRLSQRMLVDTRERPSHNATVDRGLDDSSTGVNASEATTPQPTPEPTTPHSPFPRRSRRA